MKKRYVIIVIAIGTLIWFVIFLKHLNDNSSAAYEKDHLDFANTCPVEYLNLFQPKQELKFIESYKNKWRFPITNFRYKEIFFLEIYKLGKIKNQSLQDFIDLEHEDEHISYDQYYSGIENSPVLDISYRSGDPIKISKGIVFNIMGSDTQSIVHNDSVYYYSSNLKDLSITYKANQNNKQEIFIRSSEKDDLKRVPVQVMFLKKNNNLYFLVMCPNNGFSAVTDNLLKELIRK